MRSLLAGIGPSLALLAVLPAWEVLRAEVAPSLSGLIVKCRPGDFHPRFATAHHEARS